MTLYVPILEEVTSSLCKIGSSFAIKSAHGNNDDDEAAAPENRSLKAC